MSNFFGLIKHGPKAGKYVMETLVPKISKNLKQKFEAKQKLFKSVDEKGSGLTTAEKGKFKKQGSQKIDKVFEKYENRANKMAGGFMGKRMGYKRGSGKKSNIEKIKKTFGANKKTLGMQSVIYGLDKNPNITAADPKAKFIAAANKKKKKKVI